MDAKLVGLAILLLGILLLVGKYLRVRVRWMQKLFLPSSIIGGFVALILGPQVLGKIGGALGNSWLENGGLFIPEILKVWSSLPGLLISVVFATLFLGQKLPSAKKVIDLAGPQLSVGISYASGQYLVGLLLVILVLTPVFGISPMAGALIEIGFEGGHGTAGGMMAVFEEMGWAEGGDLAIGTATVGLVGGIVLGIAFINWAVRTGRTKIVKEKAKQSAEEQAGLFRRDEQYVGAHLTSRPSSIEPLSLHIGIVALSILVGQLILSALKEIENLLWADHFKLMAYVPLFPLAMIGGILVQLCLKKIGYDHIVDEQMMLRIQGLGLDFLIVSAIASLSLDVIASHFWPFVILCIGGIAINVFVLLWLCPRTIPDYWFERGIGDFGQSMGVTATGLILMRVVDPEGKSPAFAAFGYKQLVFEPFFGGGIVTAIAVPIIAQFGPIPLCIVMGILFFFALLTGIFYWGKKPSTLQEEKSYGTVYPPQD